ncbi:hypothetical protein Q73_08730 [Bacillus coahuilensis m2-6]|uniref:LCP family protein n=1 Tax=Bacillus coahuilensis TaxID=408580 RepID=UPI0007502417|nr:LCP family protein [Bacillus coahuilensis]KUP07458.1 hypothetical protein Q73_08730 [Bacillus coahuilensis m2-6]
MEGSRTSRRVEKQRKKRGKFKIAIFISLCLFLVGGGFIFFQYYAGVNSTGANSALNSLDIEFNGVDNQNDKVVNVLLLGIDAREGEQTSRTDTIMVAQHNSETGESKLISFMRDAYVQIPGHDSNKINAAYALGGPELLRETLRHNFDIELQSYAIVDFSGFVTIIDELFPSGIEVTVEKEMSEKVSVPLYPGTQRLNGEQLLSFVRFRQDAEGDFGRVGRQQEALGIIVQEFKTVNGVANIPKGAGMLQNYMKTNVKNTTVLSVAKSIISGEQNIKTLRVPLDNTYTNERISGAGLVLNLDIEANKQAVQQFLEE